MVFAPVAAVTVVSSGFGASLTAVASNVVTFPTGSVTFRVWTPFADDRSMVVTGVTPSERSGEITWI